MKDKKIEQNKKILNLQIKITKLFNTFFQFYLYLFFNQQTDDQNIYRIDAHL